LTAGRAALAGIKNCRCSAGHDEFSVGCGIFAALGRCSAIALHHGYAAATHRAADLLRALPRAIRVRIPLESSGETTIDNLHSLFLERKGEAKVLFDVERQGDFMVVMEAEGYNVIPDRNFIARVEQLCGRGSVRIIS